MPLSGIRKKKLSTFCHSQLTDSIAKREKLAMWTCDRCLTGGKECKVLDNCDKCEACVWLGVSCDLYIFPKEIDKVSKEILQLEKEKDAVTAQKREMKAKKERLHKQIAFLKKCRSELIRTELWNIEELEAEEQAAAVTAGPSNGPPLIFLTPKAFSLSDADWLPADFFAGTGAVSLHNE